MSFLDRIFRPATVLQDAYEQLELQLGEQLHALSRANDAIERLQAAAAERNAALRESELARAQLELLLDAAVFELAQRREFA